MSVFQQTILDVGFNDFMVVPSGGDKVFMYHKGKDEIMTVF